MEIDTAAYLLESALKVSASDYSPLVLAVYFLESALCYEGGVNSTLKYPSTALLKNAGLAHVNLIQNKLIPSSALPFPTRDIFSTIEHIGWPKNRLI